MSGKLIIQGKAWGEFESAKRSKGNIEISGYRSYGGTHTVRMVDQPQLNENQQIVLEWLKERQLEFNERPSTTIYFLTIHYPYGLDDVAKAKKAFSKLNKPEETQVLEVFFRWAQEQEEE